MKTAIYQVRDYVISRHSENDYKYHVSIVVESALKLAKIKKADLEIVEISALLHDVGRAKLSDSETTKTGEHHKDSAKMAKAFLSKINYPKYKLDKVLGCILAHRGQKGGYPPKTQEEIIISNADAMAHFISFLDLYFVFIGKEGFEKGISLLKKKMDRSWSEKLTMSEAKKLVKNEYEAVCLLLNNMGAKS